MFSTSYAIELKSGCYLDENSEIASFHLLGKTTDAAYPIASVSKVFTTLMAATKFNLRTVINGKPIRAPFVTEFYVRSITTARGKLGYHLHIKGSGDPYFNRYKMHRAISILNQMQISEIELLTFDENVKFLSETDTKQGFYVTVGYNKEGKPIHELITPLTLKAEMDFPETKLVKYQYQESWRILKDYNSSFKMARGLKIPMVIDPKFTVRKAEFVPAANFIPDASAKVFNVESQSMATMLKMMNWNSNNYAANRIYTESGGEAAFKDIFYTKIQIDTKELSFINGSGQNHDLAGDGPRIYNQATCSAVLRTLRNLNRRVTGQGLKLTDVMSVVGIDEGSTVGGLVYSNDLTKGKIVAKTGTVGTNITLAGAINTKSGYRYFMFNVGHKIPGATIPEYTARKLISEQLNALVKQTKDVIPLDYKPNLALMKQYGFENYEEDNLSPIEPGALFKTEVTSAEVKPTLQVAFSAKPQVINEPQRYASAFKNVQPIKK